MYYQHFLNHMVYHLILIFIQVIQFQNLLFMDLFYMILIMLNLMPFLHLISIINIYITFGLPYYNT